MIHEKSAPRTDPANFPPHAIEGVALGEIFSPSSIAEGADWLRSRHDARDAVIPIGGGTALEYGNPPNGQGADPPRKLTALLTTGWATVVDYPSEDMTITVETGIRASELARILANKGQMLPVDGPHADQATLGGRIATNTSGSRRLGYGTLRDYILGVDVLHADGTRVHGGGRVVKNVAGYDFMKMHTGALGTLGIVAQVTLKLKPLPEARAAVMVALADDRQVETTLRGCLNSVTRPVGIDLCNTRAASFLNIPPVNEPWLLMCFFEESAPATVWQRDKCLSEWAELGNTFSLSGDDYHALLESCNEWPAANSGVLLFKANMLIEQTFEFCRLARKHLPEVCLFAHAGSGIVWGSIPECESDSVWPGLRVLRQFAVHACGNLILPRCPSERKGQFAVWGASRDDEPLMARLRSALDPHGILNPGRFVVA